MAKKIAEDMFDDGLIEDGCWDYYSIRKSNDDKFSDSLEDD